MTAKIICLAMQCHPLYVCMELFWNELLIGSWLLHVGPEGRGGTKTRTGFKIFRLSVARAQKIALFSCFDICICMYRDKVFFLYPSAYMCVLSFEARSQRKLLNAL